MFTELGHIQTLAGDSGDDQDVDKLHNALRMPVLRSHYFSGKFVLDVLG